MEKEKFQSKLVRLHTDQIEWAENNSINLSKLIRVLLDNEIKRRNLVYPDAGVVNQSDKNEVDLKIILADDVLYRYGINIRQYHDLVSRKMINLELHDHRIYGVD